MRHTVSALLGVLAAAGVIAAAPVAGAAQGVLIVNSRNYVQPTGCLEVGTGLTPVDIGNFTDSYVLVYDSPACSGAVINVLAPSSIAFLPAVSIRI